jgi:mannose-6-phosphate isomerase-like protein (cupin superfamily)
MTGFTTRTYPHDDAVIVPDGSTIHELVRTGRGSFAHCTLPVEATSLAVRHRTVDEIWYCLEGQGEVWRDDGDCSQIVAFTLGVSLSIPVGTSFQFRNTGTEHLRFVLTTMPPWPGSDEAELVTGAW